MKRVSGELLGLYEAISLDITAYDPGMAKDVERDLSRLRSLVASRGLRVLTIDLPSIGKSLDKALSRGVLIPTDIPGNILGRRVGVYPTLFGVHYRAIFDEDGYVRDQPDPNRILFLRQILYLCKKVRLECAEEYLNAAVDEFHQIEQEIRSPTLSWDRDDLLPGGLRDTRVVSFTDLGTSRNRDDQLSFWAPARTLSPAPLLKMLQDICDRVVSEFPLLDPADIVPRHGPGAVADKRSGTDKYLFPHWPSKLEGHFPHECFAFANTSLFLEEGASENESRSFGHEPPAKLIAVPKTQKSPRLIASEPLCHQYIQQGILSWLRDNYPLPLRTSVSFVDQTLSQKAALAASLSGSHATIDLSSASDRLSCWTVERAFRSAPTILQALHACRTRTVQNTMPGTTHFYIKLKKYANQGSAVTFPLQSMIYALCAITVGVYESGSKVSRRSILKSAEQVRVFGDDIIIPTTHAWSLGHLLTDLGLKVNGSKTHFSGGFRESCGMDAYRGYNVTPVYILSPGPSSEAEHLESIVESSNNFHKAGLWHASSRLMGWIGEPERKLIPISRTKWESEDGLRFKPAEAATQPTMAFYTFSRGLKPPRRSRWDKPTQTRMYRCLVVRHKVKRADRHTWKSFLQYSLEGPSRADECAHIHGTSWSHGYVRRKGVSKNTQWVPLYE